MFELRSRTVFLTEVKTLKGDYADVLSNDPMR